MGAFPPNKGVGAFSMVSDANAVAEVLEVSPNLKFDEDEGAAAAPNENPPDGWTGAGALAPNAGTELSLGGCEPKVVGVGTELLKLKAGIGAGAEFVVAPKEGADEESPSSGPRRRLLRSSSTASMLGKLPSGTIALASFEDAWEPNLNAGADIGLETASGADVLPKLKLVDGLLDVSALPPNENKGLLEVSDALLAELGTLKQPLFSIVVSLPEGSVAGT